VNTNENKETNITNSDINNQEDSNDELEITFGNIQLENENRKKKNYR